MRKTLFLEILLIPILTLIGCSQESPKIKALRLAKESHVLKEDQSVELVISDLMHERKSDFKPIGWEIEEKSDKTFLVSYKYKIHSFKEGVGERGFFFEVDLSKNAVRNVTKEYVSKMKPLSPIQKQEKQFIDEFLREEPLIK